MEDGIDANTDPEQPESEATKEYNVWQYFIVTNHTGAKKG
jgi:hypothetical protein